MDRPLYALAEFFSKPPGFYVMLVAALVCALFTSTTLGTYIISISAMCLTGVVLIQNYRDTAAMQAKLNEIIVALDTARNEVVGLEHASPNAIDAELKNIEKRASSVSTNEAPLAATNAGKSAKRSSHRPAAKALKAGRTASKVL
ncbi:low affinity iron permease family protein [Mesorhizobium erdmanii]|uniref:low affinity iron permease family protein n=1 Tax=Mesorhizobium erdmanii TaxID=1777866 RepID=UPI0009BE7898